MCVSYKIITIDLIDSEIWKKIAAHHSAVVFYFVTC
jgi:hypothetical protein